MKTAKAVVRGAGLLGVLGWIGLARWGGSAPELSRAERSQAVALVETPTHTPTHTPMHTPTPASGARFSGPVSAPLPPGPRGQAASAPAAAPPWPGRVGSEGYGPAIERVIESGGAQHALQAVRLLQLCAQLELYDELLPYFPEGQRPKGEAAIVLTEERALLRRCQTVTDALQAQRLALIERALAAHEPGAAAVWGQTMRERAQRGPEVVARLHAALLRGESDVLPELVLLSQPDAGVDAITRRAYALLVPAEGLTVSPRPGLRITLQLPESPLPSRDQEQQAQRLAAQWRALCCAPRP